VKRLALFLILFLLPGPHLYAQEPEPPANPELERQELINLEKENATAVKLHNSTFIKSVYSEDFHGVSRYGEVVDKAEFVKEIQTLPYQFDSVVSTDNKVHVFRETATVLSLRSEVGRLNGKKFYNQYRVLRIYINTPRGWKVVSQMETMLANDQRS